MGSIEDAERATPDETEAAFDAMPIAELASMWDALQRPGRREPAGVAWSAIVYFNQLPQKHPDRALDLVLEVLRSQPVICHDTFMRSLLYAYGVAAIGRIGVLRHARAPDELKARLDALVGQSR